MILRYYGHSCFTMELENGTVIATDPYGDFYNYPTFFLHADVATISHHHYDHDSTTMLTGEPLVIDGRDTRRLDCGATITGVSTFHDNEEGALRGKNTVYVIEAEGLRIVHCGDLGHLPTMQQRFEIGVPDVLLIPVGGYYTIDALVAAETVRLLQPRITIPMHYRTRFDEEMPIATEEAFLSEMGVKAAPFDLLRLTKDDLSERPRVLQMNVTCPQ